MKIKYFLNLAANIYFISLSFVALGASETANINDFSPHLNTELKSVLQDIDSETDFPELYNVEPIESDIKTAKDVETIAKRHSFNKIQEDLKKKSQIDNFLKLNYKIHNSNEFNSLKHYDKNNKHLPKKYDYQSDAFEAVKKNRIDLLEILMPYININQRDNNGKTLLDIATENHYDKIINFLLLKGADNHSSSFDNR